jgi:transposase
MNAAAIDALVLPTEVPVLQAMVRELLHRLDRLEQVVAAQQQRIDDLTRRLYGRKSEQAAAAEQPPQPAAAQALLAQAARPQRHPHGRRPLPADLPRERIEHACCAAEQACPCCGQPRVRIGAQVSEQLEYRPASLLVLEHVRPTYACPSCSRNRDPLEPTPATITTASLPPQPIDRGLPGPGLLAHVVTSKFADHLPLYRLEGMLRRHGVSVPRSTMGDWIEAVAGLFVPLVERMAELVRQSRVIQTDDTHVPVSRKGGTHAGHLWVYLGDATHPYAVYDFTADYTGAGPQRFLDGYHGYLQADALTQYNALFTGAGPKPKPTEVGCWAHARRKFYEARTSDPAGSHEALARIRCLYEIEARGQRLPDEQRQQLRQAEAVPLLDALFAWLKTQQEVVLPKSPQGVAIRYALGNEAALRQYTEVGYLGIDNNASERALRGIAVGRKNWLFAGSEGAARCAATLYSVTESCKRASIDPFVYLRETLARLPTLGQGKYDAWLPDQWAARQVKPAGADKRAG